MFRLPKSPGEEITLAKRIRNKYERDGATGLIRGGWVTFTQSVQEKITYTFPQAYPLFFKKPHTVFTETTNNCNLNCQMCYRANRPIGYMDFTLFKSVVDQCAKIGNICLMLHYGGETTLHPQFIEMLKYAMSKRKHLYNVGFFTNGMLLDEIKSAWIVKLGLDYVTFSIDGIGKTTERIRKGSNYETIAENINKLLWLRGNKPKPIVSTNTTITTQTDEELQAVRKEWASKVATVHFNGCIDNHFRILNQERWSKWNETSLKNNQPKFCTMPFYLMGVLWNGQVTYCCHDLNGIGNVGDATKESLMDIWRGEKFRKVRRQVLFNEPNPGSLCSWCLKFEKKGK